MTDKEKFMEFINSSNELSSKYGYDHIKEFVCYEHSFGITKDIRKSKSCTRFVTYCIYVAVNSLNGIDFVFVQAFHELKNADKALKALTNYD